MDVTFSALLALVLSSPLSVVVAANLYAGVQQKLVTTKKWYFVDSCRRPDRPYELGNRERERESFIVWP